MRAALVPRRHPVDELRPRRRPRGRGRGAAASPRGRAVSTIKKMEGRTQSRAPSFSRSAWRQLGGRRSVGPRPRSAGPTPGSGIDGPTGQPRARRGHATHVGLLRAELARPCDAVCSSNIVQIAPSKAVALLTPWTSCGSSSSTVLSRLPGASARNLSKVQAQGGGRRGAGVAHQPVAPAQPSVHALVPAEQAGRCGLGGRWR